MDIINYGGWQFTFNKETTEQYYNDQHNLCDCAICRNFYTNVNAMPTDLRDFLEGFGIDPAKPVGQYPWLSHYFEDTKTMEVNGIIYYAVHGTATSIKGYEIDFANGNSVVVDAPKEDDIVHCPEHSPSKKISEPYFVLSVYGPWFPWTVEDDIYECFSMRRPGLLRRLFSRKRK